MLSLPLFWPLASIKNIDSFADTASKKPKNKRPKKKKENVKRHSTLEMKTPQSNYVENCRGVGAATRRSLATGSHKGAFEVVNHSNSMFRIFFYISMIKYY